MSTADCKRAAETGLLIDPTLKVGLTNTIDAELQITPYEALTNKTAAGQMSISGIGDASGRLKINVVGDDRGAASMAVLPHVKFPTARSGLGNGKVEGDHSSYKLRCARRPYRHRHAGGRFSREHRGERLPRSL
jgi:hypothetical protein